MLRLNPLVDGVRRVLESKPKSGGAMRRFRSHLVELDADQNVGATGYDVAMQRAANIVLCNADPQQFTKLLHLYPESSFAKFFSKARNFEVVGLSDQKEGLHTYESYYSSIERTEKPFSSTGTTGLRVVSFESVASCVPFDPAFLDELSANPNPATPNNVGALSLDSLLHVLNNRGHLVVGAPADQFSRLQWKEQLTALDQQGQGSLVSFLQLRIPVQEMLDEIAAKKDGRSTVVEKLPVTEGAAFVPSGAPRGSKIPCVLYSLACFRKA